MKYYIALTILFTSFNCFGVINNFKGKVTRVIDGDTLIINGDIKVRMACVDAYESSINKHLYKQIKDLHISQEEILKLGNKQKKELQAYENKIVTVVYDTSNKHDLYDRLIGVVIDTEGGALDVLNKGLKYYNNTFLCKQFSLD